ncbi:hypothetical protein AMJ49_03335 [Parcubacteria bacterium DG_74_2]|nr:MAG: hypothetical protein AMJ49_03335 [Parcubacteria bacterium DG_74_2]
MFEFPLSKNLKGKKVKLYSKEEIEPHEILLDRLTHKKEEEIGISEKKLEVPLLKKVLESLFFLSLFLLFSLFLRIIQLQVVEGKNLSKLSEQNKYILDFLQAQRGVIYDRKMEQLVFNELNFNLILKKEKLPQDQNEREKIIAKLSAILNKKEEEELKREIDSESFNLPIEDLQTLIILETKIDELPGFEISTKNVRGYKDESLSHILGYLGKISAEELRENQDFYSIDDYIGREGLERFYEKDLRKNPGKIQIERDAQGKIISKEIIAKPEPGESLLLYLDFELQKKIKEELEKQLKDMGSNKAAAIAMDPRTGGILALVSIPSFDNNVFSEGKFEEIKSLFQNPEEPLLNRVTSGQYLIGSTIKPFIASAALEEKIINADKRINCQGFIDIPHPYQPGESTKKEDWTVHGWTDLRKAIAESCNVYFYTIGGGYEEQEGLGPSRIKKYLHLFGWGQIPEIDLPVSEWATGLVPDPDWKKKTLGENWWDGDTYNLSIGQGYILTTPLQVATAFSAIANGGKLYAPHLVWKILDEKKNEIETIEPKIIRENFISSENLKIVREGMRNAVTGKNAPQASAVLLNTLPVSTAAKTGTAQVFRKGCENCYNIWITTFAPYDNPEILLTIVFEDAKGLPGYQVAVPTAKNILEWYFSR